MSTSFDQSIPLTKSVSPPSGTYDQTFATSGRARLHVDNPRGRIRVTGWDRPDVHVGAVKRHDASSGRYQATQVILSQDGDAVVARTVLDPSSSLSERGALTGVAAEIVRAFVDLLPTGSQTAPVDYDVQVPFQSELDLHGVSADVSVERTRGAFKVRTVSGEIRIRDVAGDADLESVSGDIDATGLDGRVHVGEVSGEAMLSGNVSVLHAKSVSGDIELAGPLRDGGDYGLKSVSGAVTLRIPENTGATIAVRGVSPDVRSELPGTVIRDTRGPGHREWEGRLGTGGSSIHFQTVSGNFHLLRLEGNSVMLPPESALAIAATPVEVVEASGIATSAPPANATPNIENPTVQPGEGADLRILTALERGEISVDDALRQIDALHDSERSSK